MLFRSGVIEAVARRRGCLLKGRGNEPDLEKASQILLQDYRDGALGRISLETPATREAMIDEARLAAAAAQAAEAARAAEAEARAKAKAEADLAWKMRKDNA